MATEPKYLCLTCKATDDSPGRFVRVDVAVGSPHFGAAIPCPVCSPAFYKSYVRQKKQPPGMPPPDPFIEEKEWRERYRGNN